MKVIFVSQEQETGGAPLSLQELIINLNKKYNIEPIILTSKKSKMYNFGINNNFETYSLNYKSFFIPVGSNKYRKIIRKVLKPILFLRYKFCNYIALKRISKVIDFKKIDIVHTNLNRIDFGAELAKKYNKYHIWHIREFGDLDYECMSLRKNYIDYMNNNATKLIAISKSVMNHWIKKGINKNKIQLIYNGIENKKFDKKINKLNNNKINILFSGYISENKGQIQAIEAINKLSENIKSNIHLDIYGFGTKKYMKYIYKKIDDYKLNNIVTIKEYINDFYKVIPMYDIGLVCSKSEGFGRVTIEYMMSKLCVIASNSGANIELISDNVDGFLYEYNNIEMLAQKIEYIVKNKENMKILVENGYTKANNLFTSEVNSINMYNVFNEAVNLEHKGRSKLNEKNNK